MSNGFSGFGRHCKCPDEDSQVSKRDQYVQEPLQGPIQFLQEPCHYEGGPQVLRGYAEELQGAVRLGTPVQAGGRLTSLRIGE